MNSVDEELQPGGGPEFQVELDQAVENICKMSPNMSIDRADSQLKDILRGVSLNHCLRVELTGHRGIRIQEIMGSRESLKGFEMSVVECLESDRTRSNLISTAESGNPSHVAYARLADTEDSPRWREAVVVGRDSQPSTTLPKGCSSRDLALVEAVADRIAAQGDPNASSANDLLSRFAVLGPNVEVRLSQDELQVRGLELDQNLEPYAALNIAQECAVVQFGSSVLERYDLEEVGTLPAKYGVIHNFAIYLGDFRIQDRFVVVTTLAGSNEARVAIPLGMWWNMEVPVSKLLEENAIELAEAYERNMQPDVIGLKANYYGEKMLVRKGGSWLAAFEVEVGAPGELSVFLYIDGNSGEILARNALIGD